MTMGGGNIGFQYYFQWLNKLWNQLENHEIELKNYKHMPLAKASNRVTIVNIEISPYTPIWI